MLNWYRRIFAQALDELYPRYPAGKGYLDYGHGSYDNHYGESHPNDAVFMFIGGQLESMKLKEWLEKGNDPKMFLHSQVFSKNSYFTNGTFCLSGRYDATKNVLTLEGNIWNIAGRFPTTVMRQIDRRFPGATIYQNIDKRKPHDA